MQQPVVMPVVPAAVRHPERDLFPALGDEAKRKVAVAAMRNEQQLGRMLHEYEKRGEEIRE